MKDDETPSSKVPESVSANDPFYFSNLKSEMPTGHTFISVTGCRVGKTALKNYFKEKVSETN